MPVSCKMLNGRWRLVDADGRVEKNSEGTAVDGGGHDDEAACQKQARAVNASHPMSYVLLSPVHGAFELSDKTQRIYRKELIYAGDFIKQDPKTGKELFKLSVDKSLLAHWQRTFGEMMADGVEVPVPLEHTVDPEKRRGTMIGAELGTNKRGIPALFGLFKFRDSEAEKLASTSNVSIYVPPESHSGKGKTYHRPIRHVALTDYPVVPGLEGWEAIAASYAGEPQMEIQMSMRTLAEKLGLEGDDARDDAAIMSAVIGKINSLAEENKKLKLQRRDLKRGTKTGDGEGEPKLKRISASASPAMVDMLRKNRRHDLADLVRTGKITPAVQRKLEERYCADEPLSLCLSATEEEPFDDGFDAMVESLSLNEPVISFSNGGRTGPQATVKLDKDGQPTKSVLVKDAERRAKQAAST